MICHHSKISPAPKESYLAHATWDEQKQTHICIEKQIFPLNMQVQHDQGLVGEASAKTRTISPHGKTSTLQQLQEICNSCTSVFAKHPHMATARIKHAKDTAEENNQRGASTGRSQVGMKQSKQNNIALAHHAVPQGQMHHNQSTFL